MIEGLVGRIEPNWIIGWVYDAEVSTPFDVDVHYNGKLYGRGLANFYREDLIKETKHIKGKCGFRINIPNWGNDLSKLEIKANGINLEFAKFALRQSEKAKQSLVLTNTQSHFFIHIPKTAGTAFRKLLEKQFKQEEIFPNGADVVANNGLYPHFDKIIKYPAPDRPVNLFIGHYPLATYHVFDKKPTMSVLFRDPVERVISNIFHMKNNDPNFKDLSPAQIYAKGNWHFCNFQTRHMVDNVINMHMRYLDAKPLGPGALQTSIKHLQLCEFVGISEELDKSVQLANILFGWQLEAPKMINIAKSKKDISDQLRKQIQKDNQIDIKLYKAAKARFDTLCQINNIN